ncbi:MAG: twin-arginine translocase subunit TatC [Burkholderiales bacterium]
MSESAEGGKEDSFISHLVELRDRLLRSVIVFLVLFVFAFFVWPKAGPVYDFLALPLIKSLPEGTKMIATSVISPFLVPLKVTAMLAFVVGLPFYLYQAWAFVAPGLYSHEKRLALPLVFSSTFLFLIGIAFCYYIVFGQFFAFINSFAPTSITPAPDIEAYLGFVLTMFIAFGVAFEVPVAVVVLVITRIISVQKLREWRGYFIVCAFVVAAVVTPPDVVSQFALAVPMCLLYEVGILCARLIERDRPKEEEDASQSKAT